MVYTLYYWPGIPGRGEFIRLLLEEAQVEYQDSARMENGMEAMEELMQKSATPSFAPPFLQDGDKLIGQAPLIMAYLGERHGLAPKDDAGKWWARQIQETIADLTVEAHDVHHPLGGDKYYHEQKKESAIRAETFRTQRIPKFLRWFEAVLERNPAGDTYLVGDAPGHADIGLFHVVDGLCYAFPKAMQSALKDAPKTAALHGSIKKRPHIAAYLASERRQPFNEDGIFRHYPELDSD